MTFSTLGYEWDHELPQGTPYQTAVRAKVNGVQLVWADHDVVAKVVGRDGVARGDWAPEIVGTYLWLTLPDDLPVADLPTYFRIDGEEYLAGTVRISKPGTVGEPSTEAFEVTIVRNDNVVELELLSGIGAAGAVQEAIDDHVAASDPHGDRSYSAGLVTAEASARTTADNAVAAAAAAALAAQAVANDNRYAPLAEPVAVAGLAAEVTARNAAIAAQHTLDLKAFDTILPNTATYTWNTDATVATITEAGFTTTFTYNTDGTVATITRNGVTRTFTYNTDLTIASVA